MPVAPGVSPTPTQPLLKADDPAVPTQQAASADIMCVSWVRASPQPNPST